MTVDTILQNEHGVMTTNCVPAMADVLSGAMPRPSCYPDGASIDDWIAWVQASPAGAALNKLLDGLGVTDVLNGQEIWREYGYLSPGAQPICGPCQFEYHHLLRAGASGGCISLVCSSPGKNGFCLTVGVNEDGTRLIVWPENIGLGKKTDELPDDRHGW